MNTVTVPKTIYLELQEWIIWSK